MTTNNKFAKIQENPALMGAFGNIMGRRANRPQMKSNPLFNNSRNNGIKRSGGNGNRGSFEQNQNRMVKLNRELMNMMSRGATLSKNKAALERERNNSNAMKTKLKSKHDNLAKSRTRLSGQMESVRQNYQLKKNELNKRMKVNLSNLNRQNKMVVQDMSKITNDMNRFTQAQNQRIQKIGKLNKDIVNVKRSARKTRNNYKSLKQRLRAEKPSSNFSFVCL